MQFDGLLNTGLLVADDVRSLVTLGLLPREQLTVEAWFTMSGDTLGQNQFAGLASAVVTTAAETCELGWALGYSYNTIGDITRFEFRIHTSTGRKRVQRTFNPKATLNQWNHLVGTYDGTTMRLYRNGVQLQQQAVSRARA